MLPRQLGTDFLVHAKERLLLISRTILQNK